MTGFFKRYLLLSFVLCFASVDTPLVQAADEPRAF
jgi:hypothetical protein